LQSPLFLFSSRRRHTRFSRDWSSDVCSSDLKYPRPLSADLELLNQIGCNAVFLPGDSEIYPVEGVTTTEIDLQHLGDSLEAAFRPGHFEGVLQVMHRLLDIVNPDFLFMGQKDLQIGRAHV